MLPCSHNPLPKANPRNQPPSRCNSTPAPNFRRSLEDGLAVAVFDLNRRLQNGLLVAVFHLTRCLRDCIYSFTLGSFIALLDINLKMETYLVKMLEIEYPKADPATVASIILGGGSRTRLFPLSARRAKPAVMGEKNLEDGDIEPAPKLIQVLFQNCGGQVDHWVEPYLRLTMERLPCTEKP